MRWGRRLGSVVYATKPTNPSFIPASLYVFPERRAGVGTHNDSWRTWIESRDVFLYVRAISRDRSNRKRKEKKRIKKRPIREKEKKTRPRLRTLRYLLLP